MTAGKAPNSSSTVRKSRTAVDGEERVGQRDPAHDRAADVALVPLVAGQLADHREVAAQDDGEPLTRSHERLFILWGMADEPTWPGLKPSVTSSCRP
jgi:hypothetical protein